MHDSTDSGTASTLPLNVKVPGYRLRRQAGADSLGIWFDAEQESLGRKVTLKVLKPQYEEHDAARREFLAEMDRLAELDHPNLPRVLDSIREGTLAVVVERVSAKSVAQVLVPGKPLARNVALRAVRETAGALEYLIGKDLTHKNVTPRHLALRDDGGVRLVTFRNVITLEELRALRGRLAQDPQYVAPEQLTGDDPIDGRTHVYQLGAILFHLLSGHAPHGSGTPQEIAKAHLATEFPSIKRFQPFLPQGIYDTIDHATRKNPEDRPSLPELAAALEALEQGKDPGLGGKKSTGPVAPKPRRRRRRR